MLVSKEILDVLRGGLVNARKEIWRENKYSSIKWIDFNISFVDMLYKCKKDSVEKEVEDVRDYISCGR